jgi:putative transposase
MPRTARVAPGGEVYHVLNRAAARFRMHRTDRDFAAFEATLFEAAGRHPIRLLAYCVLGNHWHFVVHPERDGQVTEFFRWLTHTHAMRWRVAHRSVGMGPLYQGRFKSFPVERGAGLDLTCRYVERNALSAGLVTRAQDWRWGSLWLREHGTPAQRAILSPWPSDRRRDWVRWVNEPLTKRELERVQTSIARGRPLGGDAWVAKTAARLGLGHTIRSEGRPRKTREPGTGN